MKFTGEIIQIKTQVTNPYGFICSPDASAHWSISGDVIFWQNDVVGGLFASLRVGNIVEFDSVILTRTDGSQRIKGVQIKIQPAPTTTNPVNPTAGQLTTSPTDLLKDKIIHYLDRIEKTSAAVEFEDLVFNLLRLIGISTICQYDRESCAGSADGVFISGKLCVVYDCTLRNPYRPHKNPQIFNYKKQLRAASSITINEKKKGGKDVEKTFNIPEKREVWIITRGDTKIIEKPDAIDNICVREVSIKTLLDQLNQKLDSKIFGRLNL
jgi:hypothetical protein